MVETLQSVFEPFVARLIAGIAAAVIGVGLIALVYAKWSYARVANWTKAAGRIVSSEPGFDLVQRFTTDHPRNERVARIVYEFEANRETWQSDRTLDVGHPPEDQVERLLATYPAGARVTVFHDPRDPSRSALEIDHPPKDLAMGCLAATLIVIVFAAIGVWLSGAGGRLVVRTFPDATLQLMIPAAILSVLFLLLFLGFHRQAGAVRRWPTINGHVVSSGVHQFLKRTLSYASEQAHPRSRTQILFMPVVEYAYRVGGRDYTSRSIRDGTEISGSAEYAQSIAARYPEGAMVTVHYDPADPSKAALETGGNWHWAMLAGAMLTFGVAVASSGLVS